MDSSLSSVPTAWPRARPLIMGTASPHAAAIGATMRLVLSPTPPVECLSTAVLPERPTEKISPESRMAKVSAWVSSCESPRIQAAMSQAESCSSGIEPLVAPATRKPISRASNALPSRFLRIRSIVCRGNEFNEFSGGESGCLIRVILFHVRLEGHRQQSRKGHSPHTVRRWKHHRRLGQNELAQNLAASSAGRAGGIVQICNCDRIDANFRSILGNGSNHCGTLGADCQPEARVFHVSFI